MMVCIGFGPDYLLLIRIYVVTSLLFFFNDTATPEIYPLSLHDALPIYRKCNASSQSLWPRHDSDPLCRDRRRSEEHTSELQSRQYLVCRLLLEKKKNNILE